MVRESVISDYVHKIMWYAGRNFSVFHKNQSSLASPQLIKFVMSPGDFCENIPIKTISLIATRSKYVAFYL